MNSSSSPAAVRAAGRIMRCFVLVTFTMRRMADPIPLPELRALIQAAEEAEAREAVTGAKDLGRVAQASIQADADRRAWEATRDSRVADVAGEWGVSEWTLLRRITRHNERLRKQGQD